MMLRWLEQYGANVVDQQTTARRRDEDTQGTGDGQVANNVMRE